jgi:hypothetical protein
LQRDRYRWTILRSKKPKVRSETTYSTEDEAEAVARSLLQAVGCLAQTISAMIRETAERRSTSLPHDLESEARALRR